MPADFRIVEVDRRATSVTWAAEDTRTGDRYTDFGDDMLRDFTVRPVTMLEERLRPRVIDLLVVRWADGSVPRRR